MNLAAFVRARLREDEALAKAAGGNSPEWVGSSEDTSDGENVYFTVRAKDGKVWEPDYFLSISEDARDVDRVAHIACWSPARVLYDIAMKRATIEAAVEVLSHTSEHKYWSRASALAETTLWNLAAPYRTHPDYQKLDGR